MKIFFTTSLILLFSVSFAQQTTTGRITLITDTKIYPVEIFNSSGIIYSDAIQFFRGLDFHYHENVKTFYFEYDSVSIEITIQNPFVKLKNKTLNQDEVYQLVTIPEIKENRLYIPVKEFTEIINLFTKKKLEFISPTRIRVSEKSEDKNTIQSSFPIKLLSVSVREYDDKSEIKILTDRKIENLYNFYSGRDLYVYLWNVKTKNDSGFKEDSWSILNKITIGNDRDFLQIIISLKADETVAEILKGKAENELIIRIAERDFGSWYVMESEHFKLIYRDSHSHLAQYLLKSAESSFKVLSRFFEYQPNEKIIINTYDVNDYGFAATTSVPQNYIRLEIEPLEPGYEVVPYNERYQWLLSHELVHVFVNDMDSDFEDALRKIFGKVNPDKSQPLTTIYSLLTNHNRYTPRWHQEAIAVFFETWLSGGYGRTLGNFDEMYFRSRVFDNITFPTENEIEEIESHENILLEHLFYLYGARFVSYLSIKYGAEKVIDWFDTKKSEFYPSYKSKFRRVFGSEFSNEWEMFSKNEIDFQKSNFKILQSAETTNKNYITKATLGWVGQPYFDKKNNSVHFVYHKSGKLASMGSLNLKTGEMKDFRTLPSPSIIQVASTAFDDEYNNFFYTTNNNQLYRDVHLFNLSNRKHRELFPDSRVGHLTVSSKTHELFGSRHSSGKVSLVKSKYPYLILETLTVFPLGDEIQQLAINPDGNLLAAVIHKVNGEQSIILIDVNKLNQSDRYSFLTITSEGTPENVSWSEDGKTIYWNAFTNGVSNIYKMNLDESQISVVSHTIKGLFRPIEINSDTLFAFEYSIDGFIPVLIPNKSVHKLPAINYLGQNILNKSPQVAEWMIKSDEGDIEQYNLDEEKSYYSLKNIRLQTLIPVITGFQDRKVLGLFGHITDPLLIQEFVFETGVSPFREKNQKLRFHLRTKYNFKQKFSLAFDHNAPDFYDLFNKRKKAILGNRSAIGYTDYFLYDNPLKIKHNSELAVYTGVKFINDNLLEIKIPDFAVFKTELDIRDLRKTIGSVDWESGNQLKFNIITYASTPEDIKYAVGTYAEWDNYNLYLFKHNTLHLKFSAGYHFTDPELVQGYFYFGGFGNREFENEPVKQFEKVFRFPGVPIYSIATDKFLKLMVANNLPPIRIPDIELLSQSLKNINISIFSQGLLTNSEQGKKWVDLGAQVNIMFNHWANLESTFSAGIAKAWWDNGNDWEWFLSYKLLKD